MVKLQGKMVVRGKMGTRQNNYMSGWQNEGSSFMKYFGFVNTTAWTKNVPKTLQTELSWIISRDAARTNF